MRILFCLLTSFFFLNSYSQIKNPEAFNFSKYYKKNVHVAPRRKNNFIQSKRGNIVVLDWRADTTAIGFKERDYFTIPDIREEFKKYLGALIHLENDSNSGCREIVACLKKLWFTQNMWQADNRSDGGIIWEADFFEKENDKFIYLCQLDTTIIGNHSERFQLNAPRLISLCLQSSAEKINSSLHQLREPGKFVDIDNFKNKFSEIPILLDHHKKKGLYMNYEDFLNNTPSAANFEIDKDKYTDALFVTNAGGQSQLIRNVWGYCDGENMYIKSGEKYFQLCRVNNTFYFYGARDIKKYVYSDPGTARLLNVTTNTNRKITKYYLSYHPYRMDIFTGNFY